MARHRIPQVIDDTLILLDDANASLPSILVGSAGWYAWLNDAATRSFAYHSASGTLTARRERQHGHSYWYAYRSQHGDLHKAYLGKAEELTSARLHDAAVVLTGGTVASNPAFDIAKPAPPASAGPPSTVPSAHPTDLLMTKLYVPPARSSMVPRPRLTDRLNAAVRSRLTLIVAPAGWGKTTLLSAWHADPSRVAKPVAWVSLDAGDNDPVRFWIYVITALNRLHADIGERALTLLHAPQPQPIESVLTDLLNALAPLPRETVVVLDDYHLIEAERIHHALIFLLDHLPPRLHLVIASRLDPPFPLAGLRARDSLAELRAAALRFTPEEAAAFLTEVMGLPLSAEEITALEARTEGWIVGLHLAALSLQGCDDLIGFIDAFTGSNRYVLDYLVEEVLQRQPENVQHFLLQTCILDRLSGPLCDAVRERDDSQMLLEYLERVNLFLVLLDDERQWYRYHHLFAEVLHSRLQQAEPRLVPELHRRASVWYEEHGQVAEAVQHALLAPDVERAAGLIEQFAWLVWYRGQIQTVLGWLNALPAAPAHTHKILGITHAGMMMLTNQFEAAESRLQDAERSIQADTPAEQAQVLLGWIALIRGDLARYSGDFARTAALARQALDLLPETEGIGRTSALLHIAHTHLVSGDVTTGAERMVTEVVASAYASGNSVAILRSNTLLAQLQALRGRLHQAAEAYEEAKHAVPKEEELRTLIGSPAYYFGLGDVLREQNNLDTAEYYLAQGMDLLRGPLAIIAEVIALGYITLARVQQAYGEYSQALATLDGYTQLAHQRTFVPHLIARGAAVRAQVELARGNLAAAIHWADTSGLSPFDAPLDYPREQEYLTLARVRIAQGRETPTGPFLSEALVVLERLFEDAEAKMRMRSVLEVLLLRALALQAQGDHTGAMTTLDRALALAEPEGYIRLFLDEGVPMVTLLRQINAHTRTPAYVAALLEASGEPIATDLYRSSSHSGPLIEPLTLREREVLRLLMDGLSNREIARHLVLSVNTVKKHVYNICSKLGVQSRAQAIVRARSLNLLLGTGEKV